ncbi:MAG: hypothetical protein MI723_18560 [Caulobacterales bacterium]|nr:hypothetical protein [Caulobacterales bacterium]
MSAQTDALARPVTRQAAPRARDAATALVTAVLALAIGLRLWNFAGGRSIWLDEATMVLNLLELRWSALLDQLHFDAIAPIGWLALEKLIYAAWPDIDYALRLTSLVFGVGAVVMFWRLSRNIVSPPAALLALALFGFATNLIRYSAMVKPYILDAFFAVAILWAAWPLLSSDEERARRTVEFGAIGLAGVLLSFGGLTAVASSGLVVFAAAAARRDWRWAAGLAAVGLAWAGLLAAIYLFGFAQHADTLDSQVGGYWAGSFAPLPTSLEALSWYPHAGIHTIRYLHSGATTLHPDHVYNAASGLAVLVVLLSLTGAAELARSRPWLLALLVGPFVIALALSAAQIYPLFTRFQLALAAPLFLLTAHGLSVVAKAASQRLPVMAGGAALLVGGPMAVTAAQALESPPWAWEEVKPNLQRLADAHAPDDQVLVTPWAERALISYADELGLTGLRYRPTFHYLGREPRCALNDLAALPASGRVWLLTYHEHVSERAGLDLMLEGLRARGEVEHVGAQKDSNLYRVEVTRAVEPVVENAPVCSTPREDAPFVDAAAARRGMTPIMGDAERDAPR